MQYLGYAQGEPILHTLSSDFSISDHYRRMYANAYHIHDSQTVLLNDISKYQLLKRYAHDDLVVDPKYTYAYYRRLIDQNEVKLKQAILEAVQQIEIDDDHLWPRYFKHQCATRLKWFDRQRMIWFGLLIWLLMIFLIVTGLQAPTKLLYEWDQIWPLMAGGVGIISLLVGMTMIDDYFDFKKQLKARQIQKLKQTLTQSYLDRHLIPYGKR